MKKERKKKEKNKRRIGTLSKNSSYIVLFRVVESISTLRYVTRLIDQSRTSVVALNV